MNVLARFQKWILWGLSLLLLITFSGVWFRMKQGGEKTIVLHAKAVPVVLSPSSLVKKSFVLVDVSGGVAAPGVYQLPSGSRFIDALRAAGGPLPQADLDPLNLAEILSDGQKLHVPTLLPRAKEEGGARQGLSLNEATAEGLQTVPGIGKKTAEKILAFRKQKGVFRKFEDLLAVPGIGPKTVEKIKTLFSIY